MNTHHLSRRARSRALLASLIALPLLYLAPLATHAATPPCGDTYTVRSGDSLWRISQTCGVPLRTLQRLNRPGPFLQPGQVLLLTDPNAVQTYVVQPGDTLSGIALALHIAPETLAAVNGLRNPDALRAGQVLHWRRADVAPPDAGSSPPPAGALAPSATTHTVLAGDTLWSIAAPHHLSVAALAAANGLTPSQILPIGRVLQLPAAPSAAAVGAAAPSANGAPATSVVTRAGAYRVQPGDTLWGIAQALGLTPAALAQANHLVVPTVIHPGQVLHYTVVVYQGPSRATIGALLQQQAAQVGVEAALLDAIAWHESGWLMRDAADGGVGVMQLMPDTVRWLQSTYVPGAWNPHEVTANIHAGAVLLLLYSRLYQGDVARIAAAYHGGMGAVTATQTAEMRAYIQAVIADRTAFLSGFWPQ